jgi:hypothetical protein
LNKGVKAMEIQNRKHSRRKVHRAAQIDAGDGSRPQYCKLLDVSEGGARLITNDPTLVPEVFTLLLSSDGAVRRACVVVWRRENSIGVQFLPGAARERSPS